METWKKNMAETKQHYMDWWNHKGIVLNMWEHFQEGVTPHADVPAPEPPKDLNQKWFDPEWRAAYLDWYVAHSSLLADILPVANTQLGPGSLAAILGGVFEGGEDTIWIHPNPHFTDDITFDPENNAAWQLHKDLLRACKKKAQGHYYVGMPDLMEGLDVLAALKGTDKVLLDTAMQPEVLEHQMQQINDIYFQVYDELHDIIREGDEMACCYFSAWAPGRMTKLQSDISTMISEADYRRFVQPFFRHQMHNRKVNSAFARAVVAVTGGVDHHADVDVDGRIRELLQHRLYALPVDVRIRTQKFRQVADELLHLLRTRAVLQANRERPQALGARVRILDVFGANLAVFDGNEHLGGRANAG